MKTTLIGMMMLTGLVGVVLFPTGCEKNDGGITLGVILELTGPLAPQGQRAWQGMQMAVQDLNAKGGARGKSVRLLMEDTKTDPKEAVSAFRKLLDVHDVPVVLGAIGSSAVMAVAPIANERKVVLFSTGATSPLVSSAGEYVFRNRLSGETEVAAMAKFAARKLGIRTVAIAYVTTDYGIGNKDVFAAVFSKIPNHVVVFSEGFPQGETDFRTIITKAKSANPDAIFIIAHSIETAQFIRQCKEMRVAARLLSAVGAKSPELWRIAGDAAEGVVYTIQNFDPTTNAEARAFTEKYQKRFGDSPDLFAALGYDGVKIVTEVISKNGYDAEAIRKGLNSLSGYTGICGPVTFDNNGDVKAEVAVEMAKGGTFQPYEQEKKN